MMTNQTPSSSLGADADASAAGERLHSLHRWGIGALCLGILAVLVWAGTAPLDEGVPTQAVVALDTKRKTVQHQQGGIIKEVLVREGDPVTEGQLLIRLDDGVSRANLEAARQRYLSLRAVESRLLAEQLGSASIEFHPDVKAEARDPLIQRHMVAQEQLQRTRRTALQADLAAIEENIRGQAALRDSYRGIIESRRAQQRLLQEQLTHIRDLVKEGYAPRNQQLDMERQMADITASLTDLNGNILRATQAIAEAQQRALARRQDYRKETDTLLADVTREVQSDEGKVRALREELARTEIKSPASGQVVGIAFQTVGGVIPPGQRILDVVPSKEALLLEARIQPHLINAVTPGLETDVRFSTFAHAPQLVVKGQIISVSTDLLSEQTSMGPISYFLARVQITPEGMKTLGPHQMQAGMPAEVIIKTGERTVFTYLLHPLTRRIAASMKEQ